LDTLKHVNEDLSEWKSEMSAKNNDIRSSFDKKSTNFLLAFDGESDKVFLREENLEIVKKERLKTECDVIFDCFSKL